MRFQLRGRGPLSLRHRHLVAFALGGLAVAVVFAGATYGLTRAFLVDQRQRTVLRQSYVDAVVLRAQLGTAGTTPSQALAALDTQGATAVVLHRNGKWFSSSLDVDAGDIPAGLQKITSGGAVGIIAGEVSGRPSVVVGVPIGDTGVEMYEVRSQEELQTTLRTLAAVLATGAVVASGLSAAFGFQSSRRVLKPLAPLAGTAAAIATGELSRRLPDTVDPDLSIIVASFNSMADAVQQRIERDARFAADVSHELRSPLTTLVGSVDLLAARRHELSPPGQTALRLVEDEIARLRGLLEDLIGMARADPAAVHAAARELDLGELIGHVLAERHPSSLTVEDHAPPHLVLADPKALARVVANLLDNADRHAGGAIRVGVDRSDGSVVLEVDDRGPGVPADKRERVFERFATLGGARGSTSGSGLGLALVREIVEAHGGAVWYSDRPGGGARFTVRLPEVHS